MAAAGPPPPEEMMKAEEIQNWEEDPDAAIEYLEAAQEEAEAAVDEQFEKAMVEQEEEFERQLETIEKMKEEIMAKMNADMEATKGKTQEYFAGLIEKIQNGEAPFPKMPKKAPGSPQALLSPAGSFDAPKTVKKTRGVSKKKKGGFCC